MAERVREMATEGPWNRETRAGQTKAEPDRVTSIWTQDNQLSVAPCSMAKELISTEGQVVGQILGCCGEARVRHWLTLVTGLLECLCFAGVVFGWASLVFNCSSQDEQFALVFTIASFLNSFFAFPLGYVFDRYGTRAARILGISLYTTGTLLVAGSSAGKSSCRLCRLSRETQLLLRPTPPPAHRLGYRAVGNLFGPYRSTVITLYNGPYDSSSSIFLIIKVLHEAGISLRSSFLFMSGCSVIHLLRTFILLPKDHIPYPLPEGYTYGMSCSRQPQTTELEEVGGAPVSENVQSVAGIEPAPSGGEDSLQPQHTPETALSQTDSRTSPEPRSFRACVLSWFFLFHLVWLSVMQLRLFLFIDILNPMIDRLSSGDSALVSRYTNAFGFTQLCGVFCAPWNGLLLDRQKRRWKGKGKTEEEAGLLSSALSLFLTTLLCLLFSICSAIPVLPLQYLTFILQVISTSFLFGGNAAFISTAFPSCHYGKLYGLMSSLSAVVLLLQFPLLMLVNDFLQGNPLYVNVGLTLLTLVPFIHPLYVCLAGGLAEWALLPTAKQPPEELILGFEGQHVDLQGGLKFSTDTQSVSLQ
ncbi:hypothetical protein JZ751_015439, partial [Albula glossodonta]